MNRIVRRRLEMAVRVRDYCRTHPSTDANFAAELAKLEQLITTIQELAKQQLDGAVTGRSVTQRRKAIRRRLRELLRHLATVAKLAVGEQPGLSGQYVLPGFSSPNAAFKTAVDRLLGVARTDQEVLAKHGLADKLLDDLAAVSKEFEESITQSSSARREQVGASAELASASDELMELVDMLDGLNRYRFSGNAELLAAWESARNVVTGPRSESVSTPGPAPATGDVRPAA